MLGLGLDCLVGSLYFSKEQLSALAGSAADMKFFTVSLQATYYAAITLVAMLFSALARRTGAWVKWALIACAMCSLNELFFYLAVAPHNLSVGYHLSPDWFCPPLPLFVALGVCALQWRAKTSLAPLTCDALSWRARTAAARAATRRANFPRRSWLTPPGWLPRWRLPPSFRWCLWSGRTRAGRPQGLGNSRHASGPLNEPRRGSGWPNGGGQGHAARNHD